MSEILTLASEFIDRMSNPAYGIHTNEEYSLRFANLLKTNEFEYRLEGEIERISDIDVLSPYGWLWLLGWVKSRNVDLDDEVLLQLTEKWSSISMQVSTIELATRRAYWGNRKYNVPINEFDHPWLATLLRRCVTINNSDDERIESRNIRTRYSQSILVALLQVGSNITLDAASTLLHHRWLGQFSLLEFFWLLVDGLDGETQDVWLSNIRPPDRPFERNV